VTTHERLHPGDLAEVRTPGEILSTLDPNGTLDGLPFMPEMIEFCGKQFSVSRRVLKTCMSGSAPSTMRGINGNDVVILDGLRCSGVSHDGCQKECMIFWREAWLRKPTRSHHRPQFDLESSEKLRARLKTVNGPQTYFCQASEIPKFTKPFARSERFTACISDVRSGNCTAAQMMRRIGIWLFWKIRRLAAGEYARGSSKKTPTGTLNLSQGETIEVKSIQEIVLTTNGRAHNRGLYFSPDMGLLCGREARVRTHLDKIIVDGTGEMRQLKDTVYLEESMCGCAHVAFGGCPRGEFAYWREIWLRRRAERLDSKRA